jgi:hypothetical protein
MPVGLMGAGAGGSGSYVNNRSTSSFNPGHASNFPVTPSIWSRYWVSRPSWLMNGFLNTDIIVNVPAGSEAPSIFTLIRLYVRDATLLSLQMYGR